MSVKEKPRKPPATSRKSCTSTASRPRARRRLRRVATSGTKAASKTASRRRRRSPAPITRPTVFKTAPGHVRGGFSCALVPRTQRSRRCEAWSNSDEHAAATSHLACPWSRSDIQTPPGPEQTSSRAEFAGLIPSPGSRTGHRAGGCNAQDARHQALGESSSRAQATRRSRKSPQPSQSFRAFEASASCRPHHGVDLSCRLCPDQLS